PEEDRAVDKAQREGARLPALELGFLAERIDADGNADIGVLLDDLAEPGNGAVERAEQIVEVLRFHARRALVERCLRHAVLQHLVNAERGNDALDAGDRHLQFAFEPARRAEAERARGNCDEIALLDARLHDLDMAAGRLDFAEAHRPWLWREILQPAHQR